MEGCSWWEAVLALQQVQVHVQALEPRPFHHHRHAFRAALLCLHALVCVRDCDRCSSQHACPLWLSLFVAQQVYAAKDCTARHCGQVCILAQQDLLHRL